jgi:hypothetical protein
MIAPLLGALLGSVMASEAAADLAGSSDITLDVAGTVVSPADVAADLATPPVVAVDLGPLPSGTDVMSYSPYPGVGELFSVGHTLSLPGGVTARPRDLVLWDGASYSLAIDGGAVGIPDGAGIDAFALDATTGDFWLSFDTTVDLNGTIVRDADVVDGITLALVFDASAAGVPQGTDVDAVSAVPEPGGTQILLSFDVGGSIGGVTYADEDVLRYDPGSDSWTLELDASSVDAAWGAADLDALHLVPEPRFVWLLVSGFALLTALARRRVRRARVAGCTSLEEWMR